MELTDRQLELIEHSLWTFKEKRDKMTPTGPAADSWKKTSQELEELFYLLFDEVDRRRAGGDDQ